MDDAKLRSLVQQALTKAEETWKRQGTKLEKTAAFRDVIREDAIVVPSQIPGHPVVSSERPAVGWFVAFVVDLRDSSKHLAQRAGNVTELQRLYYETTALLTAAGALVLSEAGSVTEYLGDGLLALFECGDVNADPKGQEQAIYAASRAANRTLASMATVVNPLLASRYKLPKIDIGIGMALSKALVTVVGVDGSYQAKAFGQCVWRASKLSDGRNEIKVDDWMQRAWPQSEGGRVRFIKTTSKKELDFEIYLLSKDAAR